MHLQIFGEHPVADQIGDRPKVAAAIIIGTMARPSSPSVKFTALAAPTITIPAKAR